MTSHDWWMQFSAHFLAIVLGGLKVMFLGWLFWWFIRKKYLGKIVAGLMKDVQEQILPALAAQGERASAGPIQGFPFPAPEVRCPHCGGTGIKDGQGFAYNPPPPPSPAVDSVEEH